VWFLGSLSGIRGSAAEAVVDGFPVGGVGRDIDRDPIVVACVSLVQLVIEGGGIIRGGMRHLAGRYIGAVGRMLVLQVDSLALFGQLSSGHK